MTFNEWWNKYGSFFETKNSVAKATWHKALELAMEECMKSEDRGNGSVGARTCSEIREAIENLKVD